MTASSGSFDVAVVGAGPAGCAAALAHAQAGARVLLLEARPKAAQRLAGEWLHPLALRSLRELGVELPARDFEAGLGFAVFPEDGSEPIAMRYAEGGRGWSGEHALLVEALRRQAADHPGVTYRAGVRATDVSPHHLVERLPDGPGQVHNPERIIGADGRSSVVRSALGLPSDRVPLSHMAGIRLEGVELPYEGHGHVFLGGAGPVLAYRLDAGSVRVCLDVPHAARRAARSPAWLFEAFAPVLPAEWRRALRDALGNAAVAWAANQARSRRHFGRDSLALVGDAVGYAHPLTAVGMTLGIGDALELARCDRLAPYRERRIAQSRVPELLAVALYDVLGRETEVSRAVRRSIYARWRSSPAERAQTLATLSAEDPSLLRFARSFAGSTAPALADLAISAGAAGDLRGTASALGELLDRGSWLLRGMVSGSRAQSPPDTLEVTPTTGRCEGADVAARSDITRTALHRAARALVVRQREGAFEGEVAWGPLLAAQYVLVCTLLGFELPESRRTALLRQFRATRGREGAWGLHAKAPPGLFVTTLVYVAARLMGARSTDPWLAPALEFLQREDVRRIPSWGKFWLALLGLYSWEGVPPVVPELWSLPRALPFHPSHFYCHTRLIYLPLAVLYARRPLPPASETLEALRRELFPAGSAAIDWRAARRALRTEEIFTAPSPALRAASHALVWLDGAWRRSRVRSTRIQELEERIRWELRSSDHLGISPVSGLLDILALHSGSRRDPDAARAFAHLERWMWEDDEQGLRVAGAQSATWDTAFALQALAAVSSHEDVETATSQGAAFLRSQQIRRSFAGWDSAFRIDPRGGFCFSNVEHGWPVSDCTAEAVLGLLAARPDEVADDALRDALDFILRCQNRDGGFGSYEARRSRLDLEWLNPAEMFGDSMSEHSYVECTASCIAALSEVRRQRPALLKRAHAKAIERGVRRLRALQRPDGSWRGVWGVHFVYGTMFGLRGLVAAGASVHDSAVRRGCRWLLDRQRADGGWGEDARGCIAGHYVEHSRSQAVQTAWALLALLDARDPDWRAIERGAHFLAALQRSDGTWPREDPAGVFFHTALLDYALYLPIFALHALAQYETRRADREALEVNGFEHSTTMEKTA